MSNSIRTNSVTTKGFAENCRKLGRYGLYLVVLPLSRRYGVES